MLEIKVNAKINWTLDILGKRADGYHELDMLMHSVALFDTLRFSPAKTLTLTLERGPGRVVYPDNLVLRAAKALQELAGEALGADIRLQKRIPVSAGMGGGSADAAAALVGLNQLWQLGLSTPQLQALALPLGADVPFFLSGGLQRAQGIGERLDARPYLRDLWLVVIQPCRGLSTKEVFGRFSLKEVQDFQRPNQAQTEKALQTFDLPLLAESIGNVLEPVATTLRPPIAQAKAALLAQGAQAAQMTGSGCAVFGAFRAARQARTAWQALRKRYPRCFMLSTSRQSIWMEDARRGR